MWGGGGGGASTTTTTTTTTLVRSSFPAAAEAPSWEEQAFARDVGCVWPPRSYTCTFCRREFRSAQALGGHMNVHRRDRARLRQCASPPAPAPDDLHHHQQQLTIPSPKSPQPATVTTTRASPNNSYISTILSAADKEIIISNNNSNTKVFLSMPVFDATARLDQSTDEERICRKRRRVDQQPPAMVALPFFVRRRSPMPCEREEADHHGHAKVPKVMVSSPSPLHLALGRQEVDLELRLGTS